MKPIFLSVTVASHTDAQVGEVGSQTACAVRGAEGREGHAVIRVQRGGEWRRELDVGQVRERTAGVVCSWKHGGVQLLVWWWKKKKIKEAVIKLLSLPLLKEFLALTHDATELHKTNFAVRILGGSTCASSGHLQTALFFMNHQKWVALLQSRRDETSAPVRRRKRRRRMCSCEGSSENQCDVTEERAPGICSLTGCKKKNVCYQQQQELTWFLGRHTCWMLMNHPTMKTK